MNSRERRKLLRAQKQAQYSMGRQPAVDPPEESTHSMENSNQKGGFFVNWFGRPSPTDWLLTIFNLLLVGVGCFQYKLSDRQLTVMRHDERAWIEMQKYPIQSAPDSIHVQAPTPETPIQPFLVSPGQTAFFGVTFLNTGKSPAKNIDAKVFTEFVPAMEQPHLWLVDAPSDTPHGGVTSGILFPNDRLNVPASKIDTDWNPAPISEEEKEAYKNGSVYLAIYGVVTYDDVFGLHHWNRFCTWAAMITTRRYKAEGCTSFNNVDNN